VFIHIGDGACVYRTRGDPAWKIPSWPAQGEYASTTFFVTDEPQPSVQFSSLPEPIDDIAVFSDGIERLTLEFSTKTAHGPFFENMFSRLHSTSPGRDRRLSKALGTFLDSPAVCDRTDDDKTLILAKRLTEC
jgi:hypothetical protein